MPIKYLRRSEYNKNIGEGNNFFFEPPNIICSVAWYGSYDGGGYKITFAFTVEQKDVKKYPDYPFIRTRKDRNIVNRYVQGSCNHEWDYWNYHAICFKCKLELIADYRDKVKDKEGPAAVQLHDDYIIATYGKTGLALRRARAGIDKS